MKKGETEKESGERTERAKVETGERGDWKRGGEKEM